MAKIRTVRISEEAFRIIKKEHQERTAKHLPYRNMAEIASEYILDWEQQIFQ